MQDLKLTPTSYIVLGLFEAAAPGEATPYDLKQAMALSVDNFWSTPHAQVYREPERLAAGGYLTERREDDGPAAQVLQDHRRRPRRRSTPGATRRPTTSPSCATPAS